MKYGAEHGRWIGNKAGYSACHKRVSAARGTPRYCESCGQKNPRRVYHWASLTGNYHDVHDYKRLCVRCHRKFDYARIKRLNPKALEHKLCNKKIHPMTPENLYIYDGIRRCKACHRERCNKWKREKRGRRERKRR